MTSYEQPALEGFALPQLHTLTRTGDPDTSHEAAASVRDIRRSQAAVLTILKELGPATDEDISTAARGLLMSPSGMRTRRHELVTLGLVRDTGKRTQLPSGRRAILWEAL